MGPGCQGNEGRGWEKGTVNPEGTWVKSGLLLACSYLSGGRYLGAIVPASEHTRGPGPWDLMPGPLSSPYCTASTVPGTQGGEGEEQKTNHVFPILNALRHPYPATATNSTFWRT